MFNDTTVNEEANEDKKPDLMEENKEMLNTGFYMPDMADRLTQLQDTVNLQAENFCNAIGVLQQTSKPSKFPNFDRTGGQTPVQNQQPHEDYAELFAQLVSRSAKDIDTLIESLPNEESSIELQNQSLSILEYENQVAAEQLEEVVLEGEELLSKIQVALEDIAQAQLQMHISVEDEIN